MMQEAIRAAKLGEEKTAPNPCVGCVIVQNDKILARGTHYGIGTPHAEHHALIHLVGDCVGATCYTTLEPCVNVAAVAYEPHDGNLPDFPEKCCAPLLVQAGIKKVVVGLKDPDPRVSGRGIQYLTNCGVEVEVLPESDPDAMEIRELMAPYIHHREGGRAYCVVKVALSIDASIACDDGTSMWITRDQARNKVMTHQRKCQAVLIGAETAIRDNARPDDEQRWVIVCRDPTRLLAESSLVHWKYSNTVVLATSNPTNDSRVHVLPASDGDDDGIHPHTILRYLGTNLSVLQCVVEGGRKLHDAFLSATGAVQELHIYHGNCLLGSSKNRWAQLPYSKTISEKQLWNLVEVERLGQDVFHRYVQPAFTKNIESAIRAIQAGQMVCVVDDKDREDEADLVGAVKYLTAEQLLTLRECTTGKICVAISQERSEKLRLPPLKLQCENEDAQGTNFAMTCDLRGSTTGQSVSERLATFHALGDPRSTASDFCRPGHIDILIARNLHERSGHTESTTALCELAGIYPPVGYLSELIHEDGSMFRGDERTREFCNTHGIPMISVAELREALPRPIPKPKRAKVELLHSCQLPMCGVGTWTNCLFRATNGPDPHKVLVLGDVTLPHTLCRVHSECFTGDTLGSELCDCGQQLQMAKERIFEAGRGIVVYFANHEGRAIGLENKIRAYDYQQRNPSSDTYAANHALGFADDERTYDDIIPILEKLGVTSITLLTENPQKIQALRPALRCALKVDCNQHNEKYICSKQNKFASMSMS